MGGVQGQLGFGRGGAICVDAQGRLEGGSRRRSHAARATDWPLTQATVRYHGQPRQDVGCGNEADCLDAAQPSATESQPLSLSIDPAQGPMPHHHTQRVHRGLLPGACRAH